MNVPETHLQITAGLRVAKVVEAHAKSLRYLEYASDVPTKLANLIEELARSAQIHLEALAKQNLDADEQRRKASLAFGFVKDLHYFLKFVEQATVMHTPWSFVKSLEELAAKVHADADFLLGPQWEYNYSIIDIVPCLADPAKNILGIATVAPILSNINKHLYLTCFARVERLNVLYLVLLGHEIGHPLANEYFLTENKLTIQNEISKAFAKKAGANYNLLMFQENVDLIYNIRCQALEELMCDQVCLALFGPAALFAFEEIGVILGLDGFSIRPYHHPPWRYRLRWCLDQLDQRRYEEYIHECKLEPEIERSLQSRYERIKNIAQNPNDMVNISGRINTDIAYSFVKSAADETRKYIVQKMAGVGFTLDKLPAKGINQLVDRLANGVIPNEYWRDKEDVASKEDSIWEERIPVPADLRSILISTAFDRTHRLPSAYDNNGNLIENYFEECRNVDRLTLRAIECAHLQRRFKEVQSS